MHKVNSYQFADFIDIKNLRSVIKDKLLYNDSSELFYETGTDRYNYIFRHGVVSLFNYDTDDTKAFLHSLNPYCRNPIPDIPGDELVIETGATENKIGHNYVQIIKTDSEVLRLIMLNMSQSVTLDYYAEQTEKLLEETNSHTQLLEKKGKLAISGRNLKKFIGKTLLLKNRIQENLYIFDSPPQTWENEQLDKLHNDLKKNFDLEARFRDISEGLAIVKDNLELFKDILQYRNTVMLEWIIIILIAVELINFFLEKLF